ncbi:MAG: cupin domain-containing protein [Paracoccaceae bacterium]|uniref:cupin domain-containing protein n=1 Tax=Parasphingorhabdus sp. TaxID=2709688 RepID=UPI0032998968
MTEPKDLPYTITGRELVAKIDGMRVQVLTLASGDTVPWHYHSAVHDIFVCIAGTTIVKTRGPSARHELAPGQHCVVMPNTEHEVSTIGREGCKFTIVQGVGEHDYFEVAATT